MSVKALLVLGCSGNCCGVTAETVCRDAAVTPAVSLTAGGSMCWLPRASACSQSPLLLKPQS